MGQEALKNVMVVGAGGREHALGWKLRQSNRVGELFFAPGNAGTAALGRNLDEVDPSNIDSIRRAARDYKANLVVIGPEGPLADGAVDGLQEDKVDALGPIKAAAKIEWSKWFGLEVMDAARIAHARSALFFTIKDGLDFLKYQKWGEVVLKPDGLTGGKGVIIPNNRNEEDRGVIDIMNGKYGIEAGRRIIIQERLYGQEISVMGLSDGKIVIPLLPAQDHKRLLDNDEGPNTGGMGAYAPPPPC